MVEYNAPMEYVGLITECNDEGKFYMLMNDYGEFCCMVN